MKLIIASNNKGKIREIKEMLGAHFDDVLSLREAGIDLDVVEDGKTFIENARKKAHETLRLLPDCAVLADDSGLEVEALGGAPGVYSARFAGEGHDDKANNEKLLCALSDVPDEKRTANFACAMVLSRTGMPDIEAIGRVYGTILREPHGENGFGYDPLFYYPDFGCTFAEATAEQKNTVSHRRNALDGICEKLSNREM